MIYRALSYDDWIPAGETWTSLGGTAITPTVTTTGKYQKGDRLKFTQGGTAMYQVVTSVSGTIIVPTGGTDFVLGTTTITSPYFSKSIAPQGYPNTFNWTPTFSGFTADPTNLFSKFNITGNICQVTVRQATSGTSNANNFQMTLPVTAATITNAIWTGVAAFTDNGTVSLTAPDLLTVTSAQNFIACWKAGGISNFTTSGQKRCIFGNVSFEI